MPKTNGFLTATDDLRHTWEQVAWGRQVTGNNVEPGASALGPWTPPDPAAPGAVEASDTSHNHTEVYSGIWGETLPPEPGGIHDTPQLEGPVIDGYATPGAPQVEAPTIEAPAIQPPDQGDDLTPGY